ncbi:MerR family transcriptional regulator [Nocardia salmonicida]|uniref:MerR family transcriptional regulator n=1 Tax=Nocardia salmonicida TaxID=53431 RepID=A0ABZ1N1D5_9NOCA
MEEHLTVGRVAELAGVSVRTLHHYDEIGLVQPSTRIAAGYRAYSADDVERLREVLAYRRLGVGLREIADLVEDPSRRIDPRIAAQIWDGLGDAQTVLNVGAGTGSYEPYDRDVTAVEPSAVMRAQRPAGSAPCVAAAAESLPFADQSFDVAMAVSTVHHRRDPIGGLREMRRVARRVVVLTFDACEPGWQDRFWLTRDYLPEFGDLLADFPSLAAMAEQIGAVAEPVPIPWDCTDGLFEAYWRRPKVYSEEHARRAVSTWTRVGQEAERRAVRGRSDDLASGRWAERIALLLCSFRSRSAAPISFRR